MASSPQSPKGQNTRPPIAVVGVSALFPGSLHSTGFWRNILGGVDLITEVPASHWLVEDYYDPDPRAEDKTYARRGAFLPKVDFDALHWGVPPSILEATDTCQLLALIVAQKVLEDAFGAQFQQMDRSRMSVIMGVTASQELMGHMVSRLQRPVWQKCLRDAGIEESRVQEICQSIANQYVPWQESTFPGLLGNVVAGRIANRLNLGGTNCVTDAACASTFSALSMALNELYLGDSDVVLVGGADTMNDPFMFMCFSKTPAMSPTGDCRPLSDQADGTMLGEGIGMVALKRLDDAQRDGDHVYAVLRGLGTSSDGRSKSVYAPVSEGQAQALRRAYEHAGYGPETVELVEAHGTGTKAGDKAEFEGLRQVFEETGRTDKGWCALGTVKSQIGHTKAAAGAAGLFKVVMALHHKVLPPTIKVEKPNSTLGIGDSPFHINTRARPWVRSPDHPRRASVSSFGFGGSNFHIALEEVIGTTHRAPRLRSFSHELVLLHADSPGALSGICTELAGAADLPGRLPWLAWTSQTRFTSASMARLAIVAKDEADLRSKLEAAAKQIKSDPRVSFSAPTGIHYGQGPAQGGIAFLFPGQGSQYLDMGSQLATSFSACMRAWEDAARMDLSDPRSLHEVVYPPTAFEPDAAQAQHELLRETQWAQPAIGCTSLSMLRLLRTLGLEADAVGGHSFGEVSALHAAGVLQAEDFMRVARKRGEMMARAARTPGAMTAVSHSVADVQTALNRWRSPVVVANINSPKQVVISGRLEDIEAVEAQLGESRMRYKRLPVATAFHSPVVAESSRPFGRYLSHVEFAEPVVPVFANTTGRPYGGSAMEARDTLSTQISHPVRFVEMIENMSASGIHTFLEVGPGSVLTGLVDQILENQPHAAIAMDRKGRTGVLSLWNALGRLSAQGIELDLSALWDEYAAPVDPSEVPAPRMAVSLHGSNYGRPYPPKGGAVDLPRPNRVDALIEDARARIPLPSTPALADMVAETLPESEPWQPSPEWIDSFEDAQRRTAEAHTAYQQSMAEAHGAYLQTAEAGFVALRALIEKDSADLVDTVPTFESPPEPPPAPVLTPPPARPPIPAPQSRAPAPQAPATPIATPMAAPIPAPVVLVPAPVLAPVAAIAPATPSTQVLESLTTLLLSVVSEKTGYPPEMLDMGMQLEGDLGIDSIKRVEILSAMMEQRPDLPEVDPAAMAGLRTLGQIVESLGRTLGTEASAVPVEIPVPVPAPAPAPPVHAPAPAASQIDPLLDLLLSVVAEKTGYPAEMLDMGMQLEGDLGIDSIKRVEILSAMMELRPDLPEVDPAAMAGLRTLGQIVEYLGASLGEPAAEPAPVPIPPQVLPPIAKAAAPSPTPPPASMGPDLDSVTTLLLQVVAEKTGYPAEMLDMGMQLEGDLGIDSIKRVEILSAMMELRPDLPEVDPVAMAGLRTLDQIVEYLGAATSVPATSATPTPATPTPVPVPIPTPVSIAPAPAPTPIPAPVVARPPPAPEPQISLRPADHGLVRTVLSTRAQGGPGLAAHGLHGTGTMLIVDDGSGIAVALTEELRHRGVKAHMIQELDRLPRATSGLIFLGGLAEIQSTEQAIQINRQAFQMARLLGQGLTESGLFVTVQDTGGDFGISGSHTPERAWLSGLAGLARTASQEWASLTVRAIDLERGERSARELGRVLCEELLTGGSQLNTGLRASGERLILIDEEIPVMTGAPCLEDGDLVVVSGGARGVTAATVIALAQRVKARFLLLGRSAAGEEPSWAQGAQTEAELKRVLLNAQLGAGRTPHPREIGQQVARVISLREMQATLDAVNATGAEAIYASVSVTDVERLEGVLEAARSQWGPVKGLIHGAGVIADKLIVDKSAEDFNRVFDTKVLGLKALLDATKSDPLSLLCLFSSVAARTGNRGQCDYAMANEILNKVAQMESRQRSGCRVCALGWGPWEGGMVRPQLKARFKAMGVPLIPLPVGARMLVDEICSTQHDQVELILGGPPREGALLQDGDENPCVRHEVLVNRESHPYLHSHAIEGTPVIPVVLVAEWFLRTARMVWGTETELELTQLRVLRGVRLDSWETTGHRLVVSCEVVDPTTLVLELRGPDGILHYSANAVEGSENLSGLHPPLLSLQPWGERPVYGDVLFHGPKFQVIQSIEGIGEEGISGQLSGLESAGWSEEPWISDVASLDGALQLALLWSAHQHGLASLPTRIECLHWWEQPVPHARVRAILTKREISGNRTLSDVLLVDDEGSPIAELCGVETHALPRRSKAASS